MGFLNTSQIQGVQQRHESSRRAHLRATERHRLSIGGGQDWIVIQPAVLLAAGLLNP